MGEPKVRWEPWETARISQEFEFRWDTRELGDLAGTVQSEILGTLENRPARQGTADQVGSLGFLDLGKCSLRQKGKWTIGLQ